MTLGILTEFSVDRVTRDEEQRQYLLPVVKEVRERQKDLKESCQRNRCTTKILIKKMKTVPVYLVFILLILFLSF